MAAVLPTISYPKGPELQRTRYTPYAPGFIGVDAPDRAQQLQHELDQAPGRRTGHNEIGGCLKRIPSLCDATLRRISKILYAVLPASYASSIRVTATCCALCMPATMPASLTSLLIPQDLVWSSTTRC